MKRLGSIIALCLLMLACGAGDIFRGIRIGLAAAKTTSISPIIIRDIDDGIAAVERGEVCFKAVVGDKAVKRIGQAKCGFAIAQDLRVILARHNIGGSETANRIAEYINITILALEEFYRTVTSPSMMAGSDDGAAAEKKLTTKLKEVEQKLKALSGN